MTFANCLRLFGQSLVLCEPRPHFAGRKRLNTERLPQSLPLIKTLFGSTVAFGDLQRKLLASFGNDRLPDGKSGDSLQTGAVRVAHTAFTDPTCPPGAPTRASVEMRALALFD